MDQRNQHDEPSSCDPESLAEISVDGSVDVRRQQVEQWLQEARSGSDSAAGHLLEACRAYLLKIAGDDIDGKLAGKVGASDLVQETLLEAHGDLQGFRGESERELLAWLRTILQHNLRDANRRFVQADKRRMDLERSMPGLSNAGLIATDESPSAIAGHQEDAKRLNEAMSRLSDEYRLTIELRNWQLLSFAEIGRRLGRSEDAARKLWVRAIDKLRSELERGR